MSVLIKCVYFKKDSLYSKEELSLYPSELMRYFKPVSDNKTSNKGKSKKDTIKSENEQLKCIKDCVIEYNIRTLNNENEI